MEGEVSSLLNVGFLGSGVVASVVLCFCVLTCKIGMREVAMIKAAFFIQPLFAESTSK